MSRGVAGTDRDRSRAMPRAFPPARKNEKKRPGNSRAESGGWQHLFQQLHRIGRGELLLLLHAFQAHDDGDLVADLA